MKRSPDPHQALEELSNALQTAVLLASMLEQGLARTPMAADATKLLRALARAATATHRLRKITVDVG